MKTKMLLSGLVFAWVVIWTAGCGGGGSGGVCGEPIPACSGDPVGTWVVDTVCGYRPHGCTEATGNASASQTVGSLTLDQNGSGSLDLDLTFSYQASIPLSCTTSCDDLDEIIGGCDASGDSCKCGGMVGLGVGSSFSWQASAGSVTLLGGGEALGWVCVSEDAAYLQTDDHLFVILRRAP